MPKILAIDDKRDNLISVSALLKALIPDCNVITAQSGVDGLKKAKTELPDTILLDIKMPGMDGYELCREIRKNHDIPLIMVSAKDEEFDRILGLELGSDDYLTKPFSPRELTVRVKNIFKRMNVNIKTEKKKNPNINVRDIIIKTDERAVYKGDILIDITSKEFDLLLLLCKNKNQAFSRDIIIDKIWGYEYIGDTRPVDDLVKRLRKKLKISESTLEIKSVWGFGYKVME